MPLDLHGLGTRRAGSARHIVVALVFAALAPQATAVAGMSMVATQQRPARCDSRRESFMNYLELIRRCMRSFGAGGVPRARRPGGHSFHERGPDGATERSKNIGQL